MTIVDQTRAVRSVFEAWAAGGGAEQGDDDRKAAERLLRGYRAAPRSSMRFP